MAELAGIQFNDNSHLYVTYPFNCTLITKLS